MRLGSIVRRYLLPGFVFQSVVIAGGYGTGRELAEFFLSYGPVGGLLAMTLVSTVLWSAVSVASFEFARVFRAYDYRSFFKRLLGRGWFLYEISYLLLLLIVLAVVAAAAGTVLEEMFGFNYWVGVVGVMTAVGLLAFRGSDLIEKVMASWSILLYTVYGVLCVWAFREFGDAIRDALAAGEVREGWAVGGVRYAAYNLGIIPAILWVVRHAEGRRDSLIAGALAGPIAMTPALLFYLAMIGQYPEITAQPVPANFLLGTLGSPTFQVVFQLILFGTFIETGTGLVHAVNERLAGAFTERGKTLPDSMRPVVALALLGLGTVLAQFGIIDLIATGYGTLTWFILVLFVIPVLTYGIWTIIAVDSAAGADAYEDEPEPGLAS